MTSARARTVLLMLKHPVVAVVGVAVAAVHLLAVIRVKVAAKVASLEIGNALNAVQMCLPPRMPASNVEQENQAGEAVAVAVEEVVVAIGMMTVVMTVVEEVAMTVMTVVMIGAAEMTGATTAAGIVVTAVEHLSDNIVFVKMSRPLQFRHKSVLPAP